VAFHTYRYLLSFGDYTYQPIGTWTFWSFTKQAANSGSVPRYLRFDTGRSGLSQDRAGSFRTDGKMVKQPGTMRQPRQNIYGAFPTRAAPMTSSGSISGRRVDFDRGVGRSSQRSVRGLGLSFIVAQDRKTDLRRG